MPARVHLSKNELAALIEETKINGNDTSLLEQLLAEITPEKPVKNQSRSVPTMEQRKTTEEQRHGGNREEPRMDANALLASIRV